MSKRKEKQNIDVVAYKKFIEKVNLTDIRLKGLNVSDVNYEAAKEQLTVELDYEVEEVLKKNEILEVITKFSAKVSQESETDEEVAFVIKFEFSLIYTIEELDKFDDDCVNLFVNMNIPINVWPYAREMISSLTTKMGFPALIIEPFKR